MKRGRGGMEQVVGEVGMERAFYVKEIRVLPRNQGKEISGCRYIS